MTEIPKATPLVETKPIYELVTEEQACNWIAEQMEALRTLARGCAITIQGRPADTVRFRREAYRKFLTNHGGVLGQLLALYRCRRLTYETHIDLKAEAMALLGPSYFFDRYSWVRQVNLYDNIEITDDEALKWMLAQVERVRGLRLECDVSFPDDRNRTVKYQKNAEKHLMVGHGGVLGMLVALHRCGKLSDNAYMEIRKQSFEVWVPTVVGASVLGPSRSSN